MATIVVIAFIVITFALFIAIELQSRKQGREEDAAREKPQRDAA